MNKAVYKNYKSGKYYATKDIKENDTEKTILLTVYVDDKIYDSMPTKIDKKGRAYKVMNVEEHTTKNGFTVFRYVPIVEHS